MEQLAVFKTLVVKIKGGTAPIGYKRLQCNMEYTDKHDGLQSTCGCQSFEISKYRKCLFRSSVIRLHVVDKIPLAAQSTEIWGTDVGNAYLEATTKETNCNLALSLVTLLDTHW
jgi:hypothetical protein